MTARLRFLLIALALLTGAGFSTQAQAIGCISGGLAGALAGHLLHHGVIGAIGGCIAGHEMHKHQERSAEREQLQRQNAYPDQDQDYGTHGYGGYGRGSY